MRPLLDTLLVARFEILRARRTARILLMLVFYAVAMGAGALIFGSVVWSMEAMLAETLGAAVTARPGRMLTQLQEGEEFRRMVGGMVRDPALVDQVLSYPILAIFHLWESLIFVPFFAATAAAESISSDLGTRTLRYEALRTGRLELATGRFLGQAGLTALATGVSVLGTWSVGLFYFVGQEPFVLLGALLWFSIRAWAFSLPFIGLGIAVSQTTRSANLARILALLGVVGSWILFWWSRTWETGALALLSDALQQVLPQAWIAGLWRPSPDWMIACLVFAGVGYTLVAAGYFFFARRDL